MTLSFPSNVRLNHNCDFCNKPELIVSEAGTIYCKNCSMSYGEQIPKVLHVGGV